MFYSRAIDGEPTSHISLASPAMMVDVTPEIRHVSGTPTHAIVELYEEQSSALVRFATMLAGPAEAEDIVAEALIKVLDTAETRPLDDPKAYLYRAVSNTAKNHLRASGRRLAREQQVAEVSTAMPPPDLSPEVLAAVRGLSHQQRAVIFLAYWADLTPAATADYLGVSEGSVRKQLARGRSKLAKVLNVR